MKLFKSIDGAKKFEQAKKKGQILSKKTNFTNYNLFEYFSDWAEVKGSQEDKDIQ